MTWGYVASSDKVSIRLNLQLILAFDHKSHETNVSLDPSKACGGSRLNNQNGLDCLNSDPFYFKAKIPSLNQHKGTSGNLLNGNKEHHSLKFLLSFNYSPINPSHGSKCASTMHLSCT